MPRRTVVFRGDLRSITGYGNETRALAHLLPVDWRIYGVDLHYNPVDCQGGFPGELIQDDEIAALTEPGCSLVVINNTPPEFYRYFPSAINIGTFYWETEAVPFQRDWPELIAAMDHNWAKSRFHQTFLERCGWRRPAPVITWSFDFAAIHVPAPERLHTVALRYLHSLGEGVASAISLSELKALGGPLLISVSSLAPRKGLPILLSEWRDHVRSEGEGVLLLKLRPIHNLRLGGTQDALIAEMLLEAGFRSQDPARVVFCFDDLDAETLKELYLLSDAYVTASYGEGFGGPVVEALALHRPVIAPRHSSLADILAPDYPLQVASSSHHVGLTGTPPIYPHASNWFLPEQGSLASAFRQLAGLSKGERERVTETARDHAAGFCGRPVVAQALHDFFAGLDS